MIKKWHLFLRNIAQAHFQENFSQKKNFALNLDIYMNAFSIFIRSDLRCIWAKHFISLGIKNSALPGKTINILFKMKKKVYFVNVKG